MNDSANWIMEGWTSIPVEKRLRFIEQIQLDAFKAGALWAAKLVYENFDGSNHDRLKADDVIFSATSSLKEIPRL